MHSDPWTTDAHSVELVAVPLDVLRELASGATTAAIGSIELTPYLCGAECLSLWQRRSAQLVDDPGDAVWVTRVIVDAGRAVGVAGFHGAPDGRGMVEVGYRVDPHYRRRGIARAALEVLLSTARNEQGVTVVRATVSPDNMPSRALVDQYGFTEVGVQWDEEDGLEVVLEVAV